MLTQENCIVFKTLNEREVSAKTREIAWEKIVTKQYKSCSVCQDFEKCSEEIKAKTLNLVEKQTN